MAFLLFFFFLYHLLPNLAASKLCPESIQCGDHFPLHFPFTDTNNPKCGLFPVEGCSDSGNPVIQSQGSSLSGYHILRNISTNKFKILDSSLYHSLSQSQPRCFPFQNISLPEFPFISFSIPSNLTLYLCSNHTFDDIQDYFKNYRSFYENQDCGFPPRTVYYLPPATDVSAAKQSSIPANCEVIQLPIDSSKGNAAQLFDLLTAEFDLEWSVSEACDKCYHEGGQCLLNTMNDFHCEKGDTRIKKIIFIGCIAALTSTFKILSVLIRRKRAMAKQEHEKDIELFLKNNGNLTPMRYKYSTIKKITKSFGSVYKGQLPDGHLMAVKVLNESNGNGEDFMNEVASISRTSHINIVVLLGFCFEGCKRALIYDFMPNGSLEKFIGNNVAKSVLGWDKMFEIALGIARGLEYLHQGAVLGFSIWTLSLKTFF